jgi:hypothetical protein
MSYQAAKAVGAILGVGVHLNWVRWAVPVLTTVLLPVSLAWGQQPVNGKDALPFVLQSMERAQAQLQLPRNVVREYHLGSPASISSDSEVVVELDLNPPGRYTIQRRFGSMRAEYVVKNVLQHEMELVHSSQRAQAAAITAQNYDFQYLGTAVLNGRSCYLLQISPKREQPELIRGHVWVDQHSFLIRRLEGDLAKSPSWWVKNVHLDITFSDFRGTWIQTEMQAVADVRCFGTQKLTSQVLDYNRTMVAQKTVKRSAPLSVAVRP